MDELNFKVTGVPSCGIAPGLTKDSLESFLLRWKPAQGDFASMPRAGWTAMACQDTVMAVRVAMAHGAQDDVCDRLTDMENSLTEELGRRLGLMAESSAIKLMEKEGRMPSQVVLTPQDVARTYAEIHDDYQSEIETLKGELRDWLMDSQAILHPCFDPWTPEKRNAAIKTLKAALTLCSQ